MHTQQGKPCVGVANRVCGQPATGERLDLGPGFFFNQGLEYRRPKREWSLLPGHVPTFELAMLDKSDQGTVGGHGNQRRGIVYSIESKQRPHPRVRPGQIYGAGGLLAGQDF